MAITKIEIDILIVIVLVTFINAIVVKMNQNSEPTFHGDFYEYRCKFNMDVECFWQKNYKTIDIRPFRYVDGRHMKQTKDCSIRANISDYATRFNIENPVLQCLGLATVTMHRFHLGQLVTLECASPTAINCSWKRNNRSIFIGDRYSYVDVKAESAVKVSNCSIQIVEVNEMDNGLWECNSKSTDETSFRSSDVLQFYVVKVATNYILSQEITFEKPTISPLKQNKHLDWAHGYFYLEKHEEETGNAVEKQLDYVEMKIDLLLILICLIVFMLIFHECSMVLLIRSKQNSQTYAV